MDDIEESSVETKSQSSHLITYIVILVLLLSLIAIIIAIIALFYPKATPPSAYTRVVSVQVSAYSGAPTATSFSSAALNLDTTKSAGTLYLLNSSTPSTSTTNVLVPVIVNGSNVVGNSTFTLFSTNSTNAIYVVFNNFANITTNDIITLNNKGNSITCYVDNAKNLYYYFNTMFPYINGFNTVYNKSTGIGIVNLNASTSASSPTLVSLVTSTNSSIATLPEGSALSIQNNSSKNPAYLYLITDNLVPATNGMFYILNNTPNTLNYTYGSYAAYTNAISSSSSSSSSSDPTSYYVFSIKPGQDALIIYNNGTVIYPIIKS